MTETELDQIADTLQIELPVAYQQWMLVDSAELAATGIFAGDLPALFLDTQRIIDENRSLRDMDYDFGKAYPQWWVDFFLIGTNGGGGFYALRLDNQPGVWLLGGILWDPEPRLVWESLTALVSNQLEAAQEQQAMQPIWDAKRQAETAAHAAEDQANAAARMPWEVRWGHPTIDDELLRPRMAELGVSPNSGDDPRSPDGILKFADWLEQHGDPDWACYIRLRMDLDSQSPGEDYVDLREAVREVCERLPRFHPDLGKFRLRTHLHEEKWFENTVDCLQSGVPCFVDAGRFHDDGSSVARLISDLRHLVQQTPIRGLNLADHYQDNAGEILNSEGGQHLRWLGLELGYATSGVSPQLEDLSKSPVAAKLKTLYLHSHLRSDEDAHQLADIPFDQLNTLRFFQVCGPDCSSDALVHLMQAEWFRRLEEISIRFGATCCETGLLQLAEMDQLHSLALRDTSDRTFLSLPRAGQFPALQRLVVEARDLTGKLGEAFCHWKTPRLQEFWLTVQNVKPTDLHAILRSSFLANVKVLHLESGKLDPKCLDALAQNPCAANLRVLSLHGSNEDLVGKFQSLTKTALTRPDTFPELTTLSIHSPFAKRARPDTARFLERLKLPKLRSLTLRDCAFDDASAEAIANNPTFSGLRFLQIEPLFSSNTFTAKGATILLSSPHLQNLRFLGVQNFPMGPCLEMLARPDILPELVSGSFYMCKTPPTIAEALKAARPKIRVVD